MDSTTISDTLQELDPIVVVGQRQPERLSKMVNSAISISPVKIERSSTDNIINELSAGSASVTNTAVSGVGFGLSSRGQGKILIRGLGFSPNRGTLVLIDGRPDIAGLFGHPLPDTYRRAGLYSAELIKGGASTLYGSNAMAGVVNLTSFFRPDLNRYTNIELSGGSYNTFDGIVQHSRRIGNLIAAGWYEYIESDNARDDNEYFNRSAGFRLHRTKLGGFEVFLSGQYSNFDFADPGPTYNLSRYTGDIQRMGVTLGADGHVGRLSLSSRLYNSYGEHSFSDGFNSIDRNNGLDIFARLALSPAGHDMSLSGGASVNYLGGAASNGTSFIKSGDFHEYEYSGHLQGEINVIDYVNLTVGGRYIRHDRYKDHFVYQTGMVIAPPNLGSLKLSVSTAYRNPTVSESQLFMISNADSLKPEEGTFYEIGYFKRFADHLSIESAFFYRKGENLISTVSNPAPPPSTLYINTGKFEHTGWEAAVRYSYGILNLSPSFIHLNQTSYNNSVPDDRLVINADISLKRFTLSCETVSTFRTHSDSAGVPVVLDDYFLINTDIQYSITDIVTLKCRFENLLDTDYEMVAGYPMPGLSIKAGVAVRFR